MFESLYLYAKQLLSVGGFKASRLSRKTITDLVTGFKRVSYKGTVFLPGLLRLAGLFQGQLIVDDTRNVKYGLKAWARLLYNPSNRAYSKGYKIVLFLWKTHRFCFPIGFALWHKQSLSLNKLFLNGMAYLRNRTSLHPTEVLFDAGYFSHETAKRLDDYGWAFVCRCPKSRNLDKQKVIRLIPRGYGSCTGHLANGVKLKVVRHQGRFYACNRLLREAKEILKTYKDRWAVEERFRQMKTCLKLDGCHQLSMRAQTLYISVCVFLSASQSLLSSLSPYKAFQQVISGELDLHNILRPWMVNF